MTNVSVDYLYLYTLWQVNVGTGIGRVSQILELDSFAVVTTTKKCSKF